MDPTTIALILGGLATLWGGYNQDQAAQQNYEAQQARFQQIQKLLMPHLQVQSSPYEDRLARMLGINPASLAAQSAGSQGWSFNGEPIDFTNGANWLNWNPAGATPPTPENPAGAGGLPTTPGGFGFPGGGFHYSVSGPTSGLPQPLSLPNKRIPQTAAPGIGFIPDGMVNSVSGPPLRIPGLPTLPGLKPDAGGNYGAGATFGSAGDLTYTPGSYQPAQVDISRLISSPAQTASQDALMQMLRRDPAAQFGTDNLIRTYLAATTPGIDRSADILRGRNRSLGALGGTAAANAEALFRGDQTNQQNYNIANILQSATENAANRALSAAGTLGQQGIASNDQVLRALLENAGATNAANQFNITGRTAANQFNIQSVLNALNMGQNWQAQRNQQNLGLLGLIAGQPLPSVPAGWQGTTGAISDLSWLPLILAQLGNRSGYQGPTSYTPTFNPANYPAPRWTY